MAKRNRLLGMKKSDSVSTAERRLQRYLDVDGARRAKEKQQLMSAMKALKAGREQHVNDLRAASAEAAKTMNGADNSNKAEPEWRAEAARRLAAAETKWPHKLGTNLHRWRGKKPNGISGRVKKV